MSCSVEARGTTSHPRVAADLHGALVWVRLGYMAVVIDHFLLHPGVENQIASSAEAWLHSHSLMSSYDQKIPTYLHCAS